MAFEHPVPLIAQPALHVNNLLIKGTLPEHVRDIFAIIIRTERRRGGTETPGLLEAS